MNLARYRKPHYRPRITDDEQNPFVGLKRQPYFGELPLPPPKSTKEASSTSDQAYVRTLNQLYCPERLGGPGPVNKIVDFLRGRGGGDNIFLLWGDCGIGKSWFLRHLFLHTLPVELQMRGILKVIDLRHIATTDDSALPVELYQRIGDALGVNPQRTESLAGEGTRDASAWVETIKSCLAELKASGTRACLALDNVDMFKKQEQLATMVVSLLGQYPKTCLVIIPLRPTTRAITSRLSLLRQGIPSEALISPVNLKAMLGRRFEYDEEGNSLSGCSIFTMPECPYRDFPELWKAIKDDYGVQFLLAYAGNNAREYLNAMQYVLHSRQIRSAKDLTSDYHLISALMLSPESTFDSAQAHLLNLLDNDSADPSQAGINSLIRLRVLEYFVKGLSSVSDVTFDQFLDIYGYQPSQVGEILNLLIGAGLLRQIGPPNDQEALRFAKVTPLGRFYFDKLLYNLWYIICIKRGMIINKAHIHGSRGYEEVEDLAIADYILDEEAIESARIERWRQHLGEIPEWLRPTPIGGRLRKEIERQLWEWHQKKALTQRWET